MYIIEGPNDFLNPKYFDEIVSKRYKDSPFAIIKNMIGKMWTIYIIIDEKRIAGYMEFYTKSQCIKEIESGNIQKIINIEFENLSIIQNILNK